MIFQVFLQAKANLDLEAHRKAGNKVLLKKISRLLNELELNPYDGIGKPHQLKHRPDGAWSRHIDDRHRMIYTVNDDKVIVFVISLWGHYDDK
jgi:toxin YoeB